MMQSNAPLSSFSARPEAGFDREKLSQIFNSALVQSKSGSCEDTAAELHELMKKPAFTAILKAVQILAQKESCSTAEAARSIIVTLRKADQLWSDYLVQEGVERLKS